MGPTLVVWMGACALAQDVSGQGPYTADIELVSPALGPRSAPGVDSLLSDGTMAVRVGTQAQYLAAPLTLYNRVSGEEQGAIIGSRATLVGTLALDLSPRVTVGLQLPTAVSWGSQIAAYARDGAAAGDLSLHGRWVPFRSRRDTLAAGARVAVMLPTGTADAWMGDAGPRVLAALTGAAGSRRVRAAGELGWMGRRGWSTTEDLQVGDEVQGRAGLRVALPAATRTAMVASIHGRSAVARFLGGGAETAAEALAGVQLLPSRHVTLDLAAGRGLNEGLGTTDLRLHAALQVTRVRARPEPAPPRAEPPPPLPDLPEELFDVEPDPEPAPAPAALEGDRIVIADQLQFRVGTAELLDVSLPVLAGVAEVLEDHTEIAHLVVEGHASAEGEHADNYALSVARAQAVWERLVLHGIDPRRLSYRGYGESIPLVEGDDEAAYRQNRRVEFLVVSRDGAPVGQAPDTVPWTGAPLE